MPPACPEHHRGPKLKATQGDQDQVPRTEDQLEEIVRKLREFIYATIEPRKDAVLVANLLESTKVTERL